MEATQKGSSGMLLLLPEQRACVMSWFQPEQPARLTGMHVLNTGNGVIFADRWPSPRVLLAETAGSYVLAGDPDGISLDDLQSHIRGSVAVRDEFAPRLLSAFPNARRVEKRVSCLTQVPDAPNALHRELRRLSSDDTCFLWGLRWHSSWICRSWGGPAGLAASGRAWGIFKEDRLACVACSYYVGCMYEDVAVTTEPEFRGRGFSTTCAAAVCRDVFSRARQPIWNAALDNPASTRIAEKLGFAYVRDYPLYYCGT